MNRPTMLIHAESKMENDPWKEIEFEEVKHIKPWVPKVRIGGKARRLPPI